MPTAYTIDTLPYFVPQSTRDEIKATKYNNPEKYTFTTTLPGSTTGGQVNARLIANLNMKKKSWTIPFNPSLDWEQGYDLLDKEGMIGEAPLFLDATTANLEDVQNKQYWSVNIPYDYEAQENKVQQENIHAYVMAQVEEEIEKTQWELLPNEHHLLIPSPMGSMDSELELLIGGLSFTTTKKHLLAYVARFPQTEPSAINPERKLIMEKLQTVGTIHPDATEATPNSGEGEEKPVDPPEEQLPDPIGPATHYVSRFSTHSSGKNKGKPRTISNGPHAGGTRGTEIWNASGTPRSTIGDLPHNAQVLVEDEFLGPKREMSRIKVVDMSTGKITTDWVDDAPPDAVLAMDSAEGPFYIKSRHLGRCKGTEKSLPVAEPLPPAERKAHHRAHPWPVDWTELKSAGYYCYYDVKTDEYKIKVNSPRSRLPIDDQEQEPKAFTSGQEFMASADVKKIVEKAVKDLLSYYDKKKLRGKSLDVFLNAPHGPYIPLTNQGTDGLHLNPRTKEVDALVCFSAKYFDAIPDREYDKLHFVSPGKFAAPRSVHFALSTFECRVEYAFAQVYHHAKLLRKKPAYAEHAAALDRAAKTLALFPSIMREYLMLNGVGSDLLESKELTIEIGMTEGFSPQYILLNQGDKVSTPMMVGFDGFELLDIAWEPAALHFLYSMEKMIAQTAQEPDIDSVTFAQTYFYPVPKFYPSAETEKPEDLPETPLATNSSKSKEKDPASLSQEKLNEELKGDPKRGKSPSELSSEKAKLADTSRKIKIFQHRGRALDFTGDNLAGDLVFLANNVKTVDDVYKHVLNKTNIEQLGQIAMSAIMCSMTDDERARLMLAKLIAAATAECILQIVDEIKKQYPEDFKKAAKKVKEEDQKEEEETGKSPEPPALSNNLTDDKGNPSEIKIAKAADAQSVVHKATYAGACSPGDLDGSGEQLSSELTEEQKAVLKEKGSHEPTTPVTTAGGTSSAETNKTTAEKISEKDHKRILLQFANDTKGNYQIARPILQRLVMACVPDHEIQDAINSFFDKADTVASLIPPVPKAPTTSYKDDAKTSDPEADRVDKVSKGIQAAIAGVLLAAVLLILAQLKKAVDESCEEDFGGAEGAIDPEIAKEAFSDAGIPGELAPEFMECLSKQLSPSEMQDLLHGIISDEVRAAIQYCAAKTTPSDNSEEHISDYMNNLPRAFDKLLRMIPPDTFDNLDSVKPPQGNPPASGLLCDGDDDVLSAAVDPLEQAGRDRKRERAKRISDILDNADTLLPSMPPISSDCGEESLVPRDTASGMMMLDKAVNAIFLGAKMAFHEDAIGFADALVVKELSGAQEGDVDFIREGTDDELEDAPSKLKYVDPSDGQLYTKKGAEKKNKKNQKVRPRVAPRLRQSFEKAVDPDNPSFVFADDVSGNATRLTATADVINNVKPVNIMGKTAIQRAALKTAENKLKTINNMISGMGTSPLGSPAKPGPVLAKRQKDAQAAVTAAKADLEAKQEEISKEPPSMEIQFTNQATLEYVVPWVLNENEISDNYKMIIAEESIPSNDEEGMIIDSVNSPSVMLGEVEKYKFDIEEGTYQSELFANFLTRRFLEAGKISTAGLPAITTSFKNKEPGYSELKIIYNQIFQDFIQKTVRQIAISPIFDLEYFEQLSFSSAAVENTNVVGCPPSDGEPVDLLALAKIQDEVKDGYGKSCKPVRPEMPRGHAFKDTCRHGIVKTFIRLHALEPLMRSVFVFSEYSGAEIMQDNMILEYVLESMKTGIRRLDLRLFAGIKDDAREIISERVKSGEKLPNLHNINDMEFLTSFEGTEDQRAEAAIKYLALEQFDDLIEKFEDVVGSRTESIFKRFLNPPQNSTEDRDTTEIGLPVQMPLSPDAGWIRTIDVAKAQTTSIKDTRFITTYSPGENKPFTWSGAGSVSSPSKATMASLHLAYPDLASTAGTFFLEKYIRIEDLPDSDIPDSQIKKLIRKRVGGPDGPSSEYLESPSKWASKLGDKALGQTSAHLAGIVNIDAWNEFIKELKNNENVDFDGVKISSFFKPWKYGMRLVYVPPMAENAFNTGEKMGKLTSHSVGTAQPEGTWASMSSSTFVGSAFSMKTGGLKAYEELMEAVTDSQGSLGTTEKAMGDYFGKGVGALMTESKARHEKAFILKEEIALEQSFTTITEKPPSGATGSPNGTHKDQGSIYSTHSRFVYIIPLTSTENEIVIENVTDFSLEEHIYSANSFREQLIETEEFKFLFKYVFPLPRMLTLLTIYNANAVALSIPETASAFNRTKGVLRNLYYSLSPDETGANWWQRESLATRELGGNPGSKEAQESSISPGGGPDLIAMALRTIPLFCRGMAEYMDPHYKLVSKLTDAGIFPPGKTWYSVPILWPANFPFGWGPPLTAWGMLAYGVPELPGDKKAKYSSKAGSIVDADSVLNNVECDD